MKRLLDEARKLIRINSVTANGNEEVANHLATLLQERGFKVNLQQVTHSRDDLSKRQFNLIGVLGDPLVDKKIRKGILLNTHLDTVGPGLAEYWTETNGDPFAATVKDGKIYGLGTADVKLDFLCKLMACEKFREKKLKQPIYLVGTCGEELGMFGAKYLIKSGALNPRFVVVGEPSDLKVVYAHKCLNLFRVSVSYQQVERDAKGFNRRIDLHTFGKSAHSSYPHLGRNAIQAALEFIQKATQCGFEIKYTKIEGGETVNKVPDRAMTQFYITSHQFEDFKRFFRETYKNEAGRERTARVELGGVGDVGVRFLPDVVFSCLQEINTFFKALTTELESKTDPTYNPAHSTVNFGLLRQRPGGVDMHFDFRLLPDQSPQEIEQKIKEGIQKISANYPNLNVEAVLERMNPGLNMTMDHELTRLCKESMSAAGVSPEFDKKATSTEAAQYFGAGYEAVVFGPGKSMGNSHSPNENNILEHLEKAVAFYEQLIARVCL